MSRRNIFRNLRRSVLSGSAIAIAVATMVFLFAFIGGMKKDMAQQIQDMVTGEVRIQHQDYEKNENFFPLYLAIPGVDAYLQTLDSRADVQAAVPRTAFPGVYFQEDEQKPLLGWAVDFVREEKFAGFQKHLVEGSLPKDGEREVILGATLAQDLNLKVGNEISILYRTAKLSSNYMSFRISGLISLPLGAMNKKLFLVSRQTLGAKLFLEDRATQILVKTREGQVDSLVQSLKKDAPKDWDIRSWENVPTLYSFMGLAEFIYDFIALFFYLLASTVIISTTMMVIFERVREIGTISALGMTEKEILRLFLLEAFQISVAGTLVGLALGLLVVIPLSYTGIDMRALTDKLDFGLSGLIYPALNFRSLVIVPLAAILVATLAALIPARRSTRIQPVEALRTYS